MNRLAISVLGIMLVLVSPVQNAAVQAQASSCDDILPTGVLVRLGATGIPHADEIDSLIYSPQGDVLASVSRYRSIRVWNAQSGDEVWQASNTPKCAAFSPDGGLLALGAWDAIHILAIASGDEILQLKGQQDHTSCIAFSSDGKLVASAGTNPTFLVSEVATGKVVCQIQLPYVSSNWHLALTSDGRLLACGGTEKADHAGVIGCWDARTGKELALGKGPRYSVTFAAFSRDGKTCYCAGPKDLEVWHVAPCQRGQSLRQEEFNFTCFALSPDGGQIASASCKGIIQLWDSDTLKELKRFEKAGTCITAIAFSPHDNKVATAESGVIRLWDVITGERCDPRQGQEKKVESVTFIQKGRQILSATEEAVRLWDATTGNLVRQFEDGAANGKLLTVSEVLSI